MFLKLKYELKRIIVSQFSFINRQTNHREDKILIYDAMSTKGCNSGALFDFLIEKGYNKKYRIVYAVRNYKKFRTLHLHNVKFIGKMSSVSHFLTSKYVFYRATWLMIKPVKGQQVIQMWHGSPIKRDTTDQVGRKTDNPYFTGFLSASPHFDSIYSEVFHVPIKKMIRCGHPRTDDLFKSSPNYDFGIYKKLILWTPTYRKRQHATYAGIKQMEHDDTLIPLIHTDRFHEVNEYLRQKGIKVVIKLHPLQSLDNYDLTELDHFMLLSHQEFLERGMSLYPFMKQCDALITDYSSIYWDYLVLDRPIGFTEDDIEEYADGRGFIMDDPEKFKPGAKLHTMEDFYQFIDDVAAGIDNYKLQRKEINDYGNPVTDGYSCQRVLEAVGITL